MYQNPIISCPATVKTGLRKDWLSTALFKYVVETSFEDQPHNISIHLSLFGPSKSLYRSSSEAYRTQSFSKIFFSNREEKLKIFKTFFIKKLYPFKKLSLIGKNLWRQRLKYTVLNQYDEQGIRMTYFILSITRLLLILILSDSVKM